MGAQYTAAGYTLPIQPGSNTPYAKAVIADGPSLYWRLDEASGTTANDLSGNGNNGLYNSGDTLGVSGAITDGSSPADTAITTDGNDDGVMVATSATPSPSTFSIEAWFKTTNANGKIIGFGNSSSPTGSGNYDKHIYFNRRQPELRRVERRGRRGLCAFVRRTWRTASGITSSAPRTALG